MNTLILLFYRIVTFFTRVPIKTRVEHARFYAQNEVNTLNHENGTISSQNGLNDLPFGRGNMAANGCGPIALHNAIVMLEKKQNPNISEASAPLLSSIIEYLEKKGPALYGKFGSSPFAINSFLKKRGYETKLLTKNNESKLNDFSKEFDTFISVIYNNAKSIKYGLHFICVTKNDDGSFTAFNPHANGSTLFGTLSACSQDKIKNVCTIGVKK